jgi:hypothetical protein
VCRVSLLGRRTRCSSPKFAALVPTVFLVVYIELGYVDKLFVSYVALEVYGGTFGVFF